MKRADAPPAGWYPDPTGRAGLRWWDGQDWTDHRRAPVPSTGFEYDPEEAAAERRAQAATDAAEGAKVPWSPSPGSMGRVSDQTAEVMAEARKAARAEVERAMGQLTDRASAAREQLTPLISQYGDRVMRGLRIVGVIAIALLVLWMVLQTVGQTSLLNWIGDRIDNLTDGTAQGLGVGTWVGSNP